MLTIEIHVDNLDEKQTSPRKKKPRGDKKTRKAGYDSRVVMLMTTLNLWFSRIK
jgi:hypothetical protein